MVERGAGRAENFQRGDRDIGDEKGIADPRYLIPCRSLAASARSPLGIER
jgi:hypothetical protein